MRRAMCVSATVACLVATGAVLAQEQARFPVAKTLIVNRRDRYGQIQPGALSLLAEPDVRNDLKLSDEQQRRVNAILTRPQQPTVFKPSLPLSDEEKKERAKGYSQEVDEVTDVLTDTQRARLEQLLIQVQGVFVVVRVDIAKPLGLTDEQKTKLRQIAKAAPQPPSVGELGKMTDEERQRAIDRWVAGRNKLEEEMLGVLDVEQKARFKKMRGESFTFPPTQKGANVAALLNDDR